MPLGILHDAQHRREFGARRIIEAVKCGIAQRRKQLPRPISAEVQEKDAIAVSNAVIAANHGRGDKLIRFPPIPRRIQRRFSALRGFTSPMHNGPIGRLDPLPPIVAIHGEEPAGQRGDLAHIAKVFLKRREEPGGAGGRCIAAIGKQMQQHPNAPPRQRLRSRRDMALMGVHAARAHQPHKMRGPAGRFQLVGEGDQFAILRKTAVLDGPIDLRQVHPHDPPGADIHMPDFGVAHLPLRQPDIRSRTGQHRRRLRGHKRVVVRRVGQGRRIALTLFAIAPAIKDAQYNRPVHARHLHLARCAFIFGP